MRKVTGSYAICLVSVVVWVFLTTNTAFSGCTSWEDNYKPVLSWNDLVKDFILYYRDTTEADSKHTPTEAISAVKEQEYVWTYDKSCWIATGCNVVAYEGYASTAWECYEHNERFGGGPSPADNPFGGAPLVANSGSHFTFDDKGHPHWVLKQHGWSESMSNGPHIALADVWLINPVAWCIERVNCNHPVGLGIRFANGNRHYITLWDIIWIPGIATIVDITDSDDEYLGLKTYEHHWDELACQWKIKGYKWARAPAEDVFVDYIVSWHDEPSEVEETTWGTIKAMYR